jgi:hypothetical protein
MGKINQVTPHPLVMQIIKRAGCFPIPLLLTSDLKPAHVTTRRGSLL